MAGRLETDVAFSWPATVKYLAFGIVICGVGVMMFQADETLIRLIGAIAILAGVGTVVTLPFIGVYVAPCPVCGNRIEIFDKAGNYLKCAKCLEYFETSGGRLRQMDEAHVAEKPRFEAPLPWWDDLRTPTGATMTIGGPKDYITDRLHEAILTTRIPDRTVAACWPDACCVCGSAPARYESLAQEVNAGPDGIIAGVRSRKLVVRVDGIPHCGQHENGVTMSESSGECGRLLFFRSYAYRNAFRRANPWQITWR